MSKLSVKSGRKKENKKSENEKCQKRPVIYNNISLNNIRKKNERSELCARKAKREKIKKFFDWSRIDKGGKPIISFSPTPEERRKILEVIDNLTARSQLKKDLISKLGKEFGRQYLRYRRALQRSEGKRASWLISPESRKYTEKAGVLCIRAGVTPWQVLKYWHEHKDDMFDGRLDVPPLKFVTSEHAIDTVACSDSVTEVENSEHGNSFTSVNQLDPKLRTVLRKGGFDVGKYNDSFILGVQHAAKTIASGVSIFLSPGPTKKMAKFLAKNYYNKKKVSK